jgi:hypothetical protein
MVQVRAARRIIREMAMKKNFILSGPAALRPTWKGNLLMLVVAVAIAFAIAS